MERLKQIGYETQSDVARALCKTDYFSPDQVNAVRPYLNQVMNGKKPMSDNLRNGLSALAPEDEKLIALLERVPSKRENPFNRVPKCRT